MCTTDEAFRPTPEQERRIQIMHQTSERMAAFTLPYITSIAKVLSETEGEFVGSGSFMVFNGEVFLVTAEHVIRESQANERQTGGLTGRPSLGAAFSNGHGKPYQRVTAKYITSAELDVGLARVHLERSPIFACCPCPSSQIALTAGPLNDALFVQGFPEEYSHFSILGPHPALHSRPLAWCSTVETTDLEGFDPNKHFAIGVDPRFAEYSDHTSATLPKFGGMSGSAVWNTRRSELGDKWQPSDARVVGVVHRWNHEQRILICTRIEYVHGLVAANATSSP